MNEQGSNTSNLPAIRRSSLTVIATVVSLVYLVGAGLLASLHGVPDVHTLDALGGFLSGVFSPLAFLWLIVGYVSQRDELHAQREELALQRALFAEQVLEMRASAKALESQARATDRIASLTELETKEARRHREAGSSPNLELTWRKVNSTDYELCVRNTGAGAIGFHIRTFDGQWETRDAYAELAQIGTDDTRSYMFSPKAGRQSRFSVQTAYEDRVAGCRVIETWNVDVETGHVKLLPREYAKLPVV